MLPGQSPGLERVVMIYALEGVLRASLRHGGPQGADKRIRLPPRGIFGQALEINDWRLQFGMLWQFPPRGRDHAVDSFVRQREAQYVATHQPRGSDKQKFHNELPSTVAGFKSSDFSEQRAVCSVPPRDGRNIDRGGARVASIGAESAFRLPARFCACLGTGTVPDRPPLSASPERGLIMVPHGCVQPADECFFSRPSPCTPRPSFFLY